jgi:hypothetical protein
VFATISTTALASVSGIALYPRVSRVWRRSVIRTNRYWNRAPREERITKDEESTMPTETSWSREKMTRRRAVSDAIPTERDVQRAVRLGLVPMNPVRGFTKMRGPGERLEDLG